MENPYVGEAGTESDGSVGGLEEAPVFFLGAEACLLGGFVEDVGGRRSVLGEAGDAKAVLQCRSSEIRIPVKEGEGVGPFYQPHDLELEGDPVPLWRLIASSVHGRCGIEAIV